MDDYRPRWDMAPTYELVMLQSFRRTCRTAGRFPTRSDKEAREYMGNAVPQDAAERMGAAILLPAA